MHSIDQPSRFQDIATRLSLLSEPAALVDRYGVAIHRYLRALLRDEDPAAEAASEFAIKVLRGDLARWAPGTGRFRDYLKKAVRNTALDYQRKQPMREKQVEDLADLARTDNGADPVWENLWRTEILNGALKQLEAYERQHPDNVFHTVIAVLGEEEAVDSEQLAARLTERTGRRYRAANARKQKERARRKLAELLLEEVKSTLEEPTPEEVEQELRYLGLMPYVDQLLPSAWRGGPGT
jgi:DNA-directed RNA polymerase specialized sigma24 family protein